MADPILEDQAYPSSAAPKVDGCLVYVGGDTPHVWSDAEMNAAPGRFRVPCYVRSNPAQADPHADARVLLGWLATHKVPKGVTTVLDLETAVDPAYVSGFAADVHAGGYRVIDYGSSSTLFKNPREDGYFVADYTGVDHVYPNSVATQYAAKGAYDLDDFTISVPLWDTASTTTGVAHVALNKPACGIAATPSGEGYYIVAQDGGVFTYGDAAFHGSMGGKSMNAPVVGMAVRPQNDGYWLVGADGGVFSFGAAPFKGSAA